MDGPIHLDHAHRSVLAVCSDCPPWRVLQGSKPAALRASADHLDRVHGDAALAAHLRELAARQDKRDTRKR